jgi:hypothetical protein
MSDVKVRSRRRRWLLAASASVALALVVAATLPIALGRTSPPAHTHDSARRALESARQSGARTWAPEMLAEAEELFHAGATELRRQELRLVSLRDFRDARAKLLRARDSAESVEREAARRRELARESAEASLVEATRLVGGAREVGDALPLRPDTRKLLTHSTIRLDAARRQFSDGNYLRADLLAREASQTAEDVLERGARGVSRFLDPHQIERWRKSISETVAWSRKTGKAAIIVNKERNQLALYVGGRLVRSYPADMGTNVASTKLVSGDGATPEGRYKVVAKKDRGQSQYHRALLLDYPNKEDLRRFEKARRDGHLPKSARPGGLIEIHGEGGRGRDWTRGCPALSNRDMDDLYARVGVGTPVTIVGGDGNGGWMSELYKKITTDVDASDSRQ